MLWMMGRDGEADLLSDLETAVGLEGEREGGRERGMEGGRKGGREGGREGEMGRGGLIAKRQRAME